MTKMVQTYEKPWLLLSCSRRSTSTPPHHGAGAAQRWKICLVQIYACLEERDYKDQASCQPTYATRLDAAR